MAKKQPKKIRAEFRKNREVRSRQRDWTRAVAQRGIEESDAALDERISGKGALTRKRTIVASAADEAAGGEGYQLEVDPAICRPGRVLSVHGLLSNVEAEDGQLFRCATRRLLKTLATDLRHVVTAGDYVWFRPEPGGEGIIERVEPRRGVLNRTSRGRQHIIVSNVDQLLIIASAAEPYLKPNLIDRFLVTAEKSGIRPVICINKVDLVALDDLQPLVGVYSQLGYSVLLVSAKTGYGVARLNRLVSGRASAVAGQSGVGKSSLLNAIEPELQLRVAAVSQESQKGRHTTTTATLIPLASGGYVVDTPGIRQFRLWDVAPQEVAGYFRDLRPFVSHCRFPNCSHTHEADCAVKDAVADDLIDPRRYESYLNCYEGESE